VRKQETKNALRVLGITDPALIFMDRPDFAMVPDNDAVKAMVAALINYQPDHIFVNSPWDSHPDHKAACKLLKLVIKDRLMKTLKSTIVLYEIYDPLPDCVSIDITDFIELKHSAFKCHSSQTKLLPYNDYVAGLNVFRGMKIAQLGSKKRVHGEGFMAMSKENFCQLVTKLLG